MVHAEATIAEGSETEAISTTASVVSETHNAYQDLSLAGLFQELKQECTGTKETGDEFSSLKKKVESLPKIQANLVLEAKKSDVLRINDPIVIKEKKEESLDSGKDWFNMKQPELTDAVKRDLLIIKQRAALDPKRHYKKDKWEMPKYFQMGTIVEGNTEFYSARLNKKQRGTTLTDEILHDDEARKYFKRKYSEVQAKKTSGGKGFYKKVKGMRKKY